MVIKRRSSKSKNKKDKTILYSSSDLTRKALRDWYLDYDVPEISTSHMERLETLVVQIWEDAYRQGRLGQACEAAIEAAEAEWFGG